MWLHYVFSLRPPTLETSTAPLANSTQFTSVEIAAPAVPNRGTSSIPTPSETIPPPHVSNTTANISFRACQMLDTDTKMNSAGKAKEITRKTGKNGSYAGMPASLNALPTTPEYYKPVSTE